MTALRVKIGELCEQVRGVTYSASEASTTPKPGYLPVLRANNITDLGLLFDDLVYVRAERIAVKQKPRRNDVLIAASSGSLGVVGKAAQVTADFDGGFGAFCKILRPGAGVHPGYFAHFFKTRDYRRRISALAAGVNINNLRGEHINELEIRLPSLAEQQRIAEVLDRAEALLAQRRRALAKLDQLAHSIFLDMFGGSAQPNWPSIPLVELASEEANSIRTGPFGSQLLHSEFVDSGIAVLGIDNVVQNRFEWARPRYITEAKFKVLRRYQVQPGDVLITIMGTCGRCAVVPNDIPLAINTKHLCCITLDTTRCLPEYLHACFLQHPEVLHHLGIQSRGAVMPGLNMKIIKELPIPLPSMKLQEEFVRRATVVKRLEADQRSSLQKLDALFASLQHRAFRGEL